MLATIMVIMGTVTTFLTTPSLMITTITVTIIIGKNVMDLLAISQYLSCASLSLLLYVPQHAAVRGGTTFITMAMTIKITLPWSEIQINMVQGSKDM